MRSTVVAFIFAISSVFCDAYCCKTCTAPTVKYFSTDAPHGFCGETCIKPDQFDEYKLFEANLTKALAWISHPCQHQYTPSNTKTYTDYTQTVTHGDPLGLLTATLDLYAPTGMPDHSCCDTPLIHLPTKCWGIPGKPTWLHIFGTGPYCCPEGATETKPCAATHVEAIV